MNTTKGDLHPGIPPTFKLDSRWQPADPCPDWDDVEENQRHADRQLRADLDRIRQQAIQARSNA